MADGSMLNSLANLCVSLMFFIFFDSHFTNFRRVTHGHGTQTLHQRCAKQNARAMIFHSFIFGKNLSMSRRPTTLVASLRIFSPTSFSGATAVQQTGVEERGHKKYGGPPDAGEGRSSNFPTEN